MTVTVRNLTRDPLTLTIPAEVAGWQRHRVAVQVRAGKGAKAKGPRKAGVQVHARRFEHNITLMAKGTEGASIAGLDERLKKAPDFVAAVARRAIAIVEDEPPKVASEDKPKAPVPPTPKKAQAEGSTQQ